jgi:hypothetical protein
MQLLFCSRPLIQLDLSNFASNGWGPQFACANLFERSGSDHTSLSSFDQCAAENPDRDFASKGSDPVWRIVKLSNLYWDCGKAFDWLEVTIRGCPEWPAHRPYHQVVYRAELRSAATCGLGCGRRNQ